MIWQQVLKKYIVLLLVVLALAACGCGKTKEAFESKHTNLKPQLELVCEKSLGNVAEDQIPDVTDKRCFFGMKATKPIVSPDGKYVLVVEEAKMTL